MHRVLILSMNILLMDSCSAKIFRGNPKEKSNTVIVSNEVYIISAIILLNITHS
jgi:hypothetical protein